MIQVNGERIETDQIQGMTLASYLEENDYKRERIAVECNGEIVPKAEYDRKILQDGDVLEVVSFVGGG